MLMALLLRRKGKNKTLKLYVMVSSLLLLIGGILMILK